MIERVNIKRTETQVPAGYRLLKELNGRPAISYVEHVCAVLNVALLTGVHYDLYGKKPHAHYQAVVHGYLVEVEHADRVVALCKALAERSSKARIPPHKINETLRQILAGE